MVQTRGMPEDAPQLAINGGPAAVTLGPFDWPREDEPVQVALRQAYRDGSWGKYEAANCIALCERLGELLRVPGQGECEVLLTCSGTYAVELALRAAGVQAGDGVVLAAYDFPGNFRAIEAIGAVPILCDVISSGWTMDVESLRAETSSSSHPPVRAVLVSHLHGQLAAMRDLQQLCNERDWLLVEDACQVPGGFIDGQPAGTWGDAGVLSFGGSKLLTAGRGGAVITTNPEVAQRGRIVTGRGNNAFPLSELQAAVLLPQLENLEEHNRKRQRGVSALLDAIAAENPPLETTAGGMLTMPPAATRAGDRTAWYKVSWQLDTVRLRSTRGWIVDALQAEGAPIDVGFRGFCKRSPRRCRRLSPTPNAESAAADTVLLHHPVLLASEEALHQVAVAISKVLSNAAK